MNLEPFIFCQQDFTIQKRIQTKLSQLNISKHFSLLIQRPFLLVQRKTFAEHFVDVS